MKNLDDQKKLLRNHFKASRASLTKEEVKIESEKIAANFINNLLPKIYQKNSNKIFSLYIPSLNEVDTSLIAKHFLKHNIEFSYPRITKKNHHLSFIKARKNQKFIKNEFYKNLLEPEFISSEDDIVLPDILIIPLLAFDTNCNRLGMGGGFFDRTINHLQKVKSKFATVGLAYDSQKFDSTLPIQNTDRVLDFIVSSNYIIPSS